jgi:ribonucleoside-diphosphate reductase alpha chain
MATTSVEVTHTGERVRNKTGLGFSRHFTGETGDAEHELTWELRTASITDANGSVIFEQQNVLAPATWSQTATNIVASKYFHGRLGSPEREHSVGQLVARVVDTIAEWGQEDGYFDGPESAANFRLELAHLLLHQKASFNSPVWFNVGVSEPRGYGFVYDCELNAVRPLREGENRPQCSACFINSVADRMESILDLAKTEGMLFKYGSGSGVNLSTLREEDAPLSGGGKASGPLSFMKGLDAFAGVIKSGGKTRRAAKMVVLNADHPDIEKFIWCKAKEEKKAQTLIDAGYDSSLDGDAYSSIFFQNANNSVRLSDEFMRAVEADGNWSTRSVGAGQPVKTHKARDLLRQMAEAAHECGDPGLQFDTTINDWHTSKVSGRINASNPCSEYLFLDDSACNLASLNLLKFLTPDGRFDVAGFRHAVDTLILAQEILVDRASYPTAKIAQNSHDFRPLGLGYANLGALLMALGLPYDSDSGRAFAATVTAILGGQAYLTSARIAQAGMLRWFSAEPRAVSSGGQ